MIMNVIWKRINDTGKNWRHVYKVGVSACHPLLLLQLLKDEIKLRGVLMFIDVQMIGLDRSGLPGGAWI